MAADGTITVMFTDLVGSTELIGALGDDNADVVRRRHFDMLTETAAQHGGRTVKNLGDGLMLTFPSALSAVLAGIAMQERAATGDGPTLGLRIGVNSGEAIQADDDYFGTPVVVASRLCNRASGGQILASGVVADLVGSRGGVRFEPVGRLALKGLADPVSAVEVLVGENAPIGVTGADGGESGAAKLPAPVAVAVQTTFFGRVPELGRIERRIASARGGSQQLVLLEGEPGVGKSRLAAEVALRAHEAGSLVLWGRCDQDSLVGYEPFVQAIGGLVDALGPTVAKQRFGAAGAELARIVPELAASFGPAPPLAADGDRYQLFEAVRAVLTPPGTQPLVLVIDDLHLADRSTLALLRHLVRSPRPSATVIVATYREDAVAGTPLEEVLNELRRAEVGETVTLVGLDRSMLTELVSAWGGATPTDELVDALRRQTDGNPLYTREILRHLLASGELVTEEGRLRAVVPLDASTLPSTVRDVAAARLEGLSDDCRDLLRIASVIGEQFDIALLVDVAGLDTASVLVLLEEAAGAGILREGTAGPHEYWFDHGITRRILHERLPRVERSQLHAAVAKACEAQAAAGAAVELSDLAYHHFEAALTGDASRAAELCEQAGDEAIARLAFEDAAVQFERALASRDGQTRSRLLRKRAEALWAAGRTTEARQLFAEAAEVAERSGVAEELARAAIGYQGVGLGLLFNEIGFVNPDVVVMLGRALAVTDDDSWRAKLLVHRAYAAMWDTDQRLRHELAEQAVALARSTGDDEVIAYVLLRAAYTTFGPDNLDRRRDAAEEVLALANRLDDVTLRASGLTLRVLYLVEAGQVHEAIDLTEALGRDADRSSDPFMRSLMPALRGMFAVLRGDLAEAERQTRLVLEVTPETSPERGFAQPTVGAVIVYGALIFGTRLLQGRYAEVAPVLDSFAAELPQMPVFRYAATLFQLESGNDDGPAREELRRATARIGSISRDPFWSLSLVELGELAFRLRDATAAAAIYEQLLPFRDRIQLTAFNLSFGAIARSLGAMAEVMGRDDEARELYEEARDRNAAIGATPTELYCEWHLAMLLWRQQGRRAEPQLRETMARFLPEAERLGFGYYPVDEMRRIERELDGASSAAEGSRWDRVRRTAVEGSKRAGRSTRAAATRTGQRALSRTIRDWSDEEIERRFATPARQRVMVEAIARSFQRHRAYGFVGELGFALDSKLAAPGTPPTWWTIDVTETNARARSGKPVDPRASVHLPVVDFVRLVAGQQGPMGAFLDGRTEIEGDLEIAARITDMFGSTIAGG